MYWGGNLTSIHYGGLVADIWWLYMPPPTDHRLLDPWSCQVANYHKCRGCRYDLGIIPGCCGKAGLWEWEYLEDGVGEGGVSKYLIFMSPKYLSTALDSHIKWQFTRQIWCSCCVKYFINLGYLWIKFPLIIFKLTTNANSL